MRTATLLTTSALTLLLLVPRARAQASAIPSAQPGVADATGSRGRKLLDQMVEALGGNAWLNRSTWIMEGQGASFYHGQPHEGVAHFQEFYRMNPFGERVVIITKIGVFIPTDHRDVAEVWTADGSGYEITYKGKKPLLKLDLDEFNRRRAHSVDTLVNDWLKQPGIIVTYEGSEMVDRRLDDKVSIVTANDDTIILELDDATHLPRSRSYQYRDSTFGDLDTDVEQYDAYQSIQGIQTPMTTTRLHNGEMVSQRFLTKVSYNNPLDPDLFNPERPLSKKAK